MEKIKMDEESCDIHDVAKSASDLISFSCTLGAMHFNDGMIQLQFNFLVASYADDIVRAVEDGVISAWQGIQEITQEYFELSEKASFYAQNAVGILGGALQIEAGAAMTATVAGAPIGGLLVAHGTNNIYEGVGNIYNGPDAPGVIGPTRHAYRHVFSDTSDGDMAYYSADLFLSALGMTKKVRTPESFELFLKDPINYKRSYQQAGKVTLAFEALIDYYSIKSMTQVEPQK
ncbi:DUF4225 domain-containing protein [Pseudomonas sp.]|uniref:DUF4225 domain-containing protein n=1 Tax=Pseudomonas sp. TaxID=306 RepID=UPI003BB20378